MTRTHDHRGGELAEIAIATDFVTEGLPVSYLHGEYAYDLVAEYDDDLLRAQVKKASQAPDAPWTYRLFTDGDEESEVDLFAGYLVRTETAFYVPVGGAGSALRVRANTRVASEMTGHSARLATLVDDYTVERAVGGSP